MKSLVWPLSLGQADVFAVISLPLLIIKMGMCDFRHNSFSVLMEIYFTCNFNLKNIVVVVVQVFPTLLFYKGPLMTRISDSKIRNIY